jgi:hypothetical protein
MNTHITFTQEGTAHCLWTDAISLHDPSPILIRQFKDVLQRAKTQNKTLIILGCRLCLPPELEREITVIEFALPGKQQLALVLDDIIESAQLKGVGTEQRDKILDAVSGLTTIEAENAFALSAPGITSA